MIINLTCKSKYRLHDVKNWVLLERIMSTLVYKMRLFPILECRLPSSFHFLWIEHLEDRMELKGLKSLWD